MYVSFDDTDSNKGLCTTYLATEIIKNTNLDLIGYPRLVRLNPAVPWKTRGNGSVSLKFGKGSGKKIKIGEIEDEEIFCYPFSKKTKIDKTELMEDILSTVKKNRDKNSDSGVIVSERKPSPSFYWKGVRTIIDREEIVNELNRINATYHEFGNGRGLIGSACGMAWRPQDRTYELISYRLKENWGTDRIFDKQSVSNMNKIFSSTFNNWDERSGNPSIFPGTPCPVLYGIRGDSAENLPDAANMISSEYPDRKLIFLTNQGTDNHIVKKYNEIPLRSYYLEGIVESVKRISGGHLIFVLKTSHGSIDCTVYEPAKTFRSAVSWLYPGDKIGVMGELRDSPRTLNIEKLKVISLTKEFKKISNPICNICEKRMESVGKNKGYRCRDCKTTSSEAIFEEYTRWIIPGWYEPPSSARRHLSKPLKRMNEEQPLNFVNSRI